MFLTVLRRELKAFFLLPQSYGIAGAYFIISGIFFVNILVSTQIPDLSEYFANVANTLLVLAPVVAMRSLAEERRTGVLDVSLSWPLSRTAVVLGKFTANTLFLWAVATITWLYVRVLSSFTGVEVGKAASGYVGLLLLAASFSALALAVSAYASSPTAAAFLGFGLLLFLWIVQFAPGFIGKRLASLAPQAHLEPFRQGVIYARDVVYFLSLVAVGVALAIHALSRRRAGRKGPARLWRDLGLAGIAAIWVFGSLLGSAVSAQYDFTPTKQFTATGATRAIVRRLDQPVKLIGFVDPFSGDAARLRSMARQYESVGVKLQLSIVDPDVEPAFTKSVGATTYGDFLVQIGDRRELLEQVNQISLTSAILRLSQGNQPTACFTIGHGERDLESPASGGLSELARHLDRIGWKTQPIALAGPGGEDRLKQCTVVGVVGPQVPFTPDEFRMLQGFAETNGRLLIMGGGGEARGQLNDFLRPWGVTFGDGVIRDPSSLAGDSRAVVSFDYPSGSTVTEKMLVGRIPSLFANTTPLARAVTVGAEGWLTPLVQSSDRSSTDPGQGGAQAKGPFVMAAMVDWSRIEGKDLPDSIIARTRIAVFGSADVGANRFIDLFGNADLVTGIIQSLGKADDVIAAGRDPGGAYKLVLTSAQKADVLRRGIVVPSLAVLLPVPLALWRLKRG